MDSAQQHWYAIKVFFNKVFDMEALLEGMGYETYLAADKVALKGEAFLQARRRIASLLEEGRKDNRFVVEGTLVFQRVPMVTSLLFVHSRAADIPEIVKQLRDINGKLTGFVYKKVDKNEAAVIPDEQMQAFRLVTSQGSKDLEFFSADDITRFRQGNRVRVKEGPFKGAEGYIKRIRRERRLLVSIEGIVAVATAYIAPQYLEILPDS